MLLVGLQAHGSIRRSGWQLDRGEDIFYYVDFRDRLGSGLGFQVLLERHQSAGKSASQYSDSATVAFGMLITLILIPLFQYH
jgi:hypothetical protein